MEKLKIGVLLNFREIKLGSYEKKIIFFDNKLEVSVYFCFPEPCSSKPG